MINIIKVLSDDKIQLNNEVLTKRVSTLGLASWSVYNGNVYA